MSENKTAKTPADGGPAFPATQYVSGISPTGHSVGMTLRDYFAARVMNGLLANAEEGNSLVDKNRLAQWSYEMADAMLKAREK